MEPPHPAIQLLLASLPAALAALFATAGAAVGALADARKTALLESLEGAEHAALSRYLRHSSTIEGRWRVLRVLGIALSALLFARFYPEHFLLAGSAGAFLTFAVPAEIACAIVRRRPERSAPLMLRLAQPIEWVAYPLAVPMTWLGRLASRRMESSMPPASSVTETELEILVNQGEAEGSLAHDESEMLRNVLDFGDRKAGDMMVARTQVTAIESRATVQAMLDLVKSEGHSRYPVYDGTIDNMVGILHVKDLLTRALATGATSLKASELMRKPVMYVPRTQSASSVLKDMRAGRRDHMAVVIDEFGGVSGIITLEDLIEEIIGDIRDEHDTDDLAIVELGTNRWLIDASVPISEVSRKLGVELPEDGEYYSLGGMLVEAFGCVPKLGESYEQQGLEFVVREADDRRVSRVEVARLEPVSQPAA